MPGSFPVFPHNRLGEAVVYQQKQMGQSDLPGRVITHQRCKEHPVRIWANSQCPELANSVPESFMVFLRVATVLEVLLVVLKATCVVKVFIKWNSQQVLQHNCSVKQPSRWGAFFEWASPIGFNTKSWSSMTCMIWGYPYDFGSLQIHLHPIFKHQVTQGHRVQNELRHIYGINLFFQSEECWAETNCCHPGSISFHPAVWWLYGQYRLFRMADIKIA